MTDKPVDAAWQPLAARLRPQSLASFVGQQHLLAAGRPLRQAIDSGALHAMVLWGPPGVGKTTLAKLVTANADAYLHSLSAVLAGVKDIRQAIAEAQIRQQTANQPTVLFVDEVHRFNKAQQDAFLPYIEDGSVIFIGATTENPAFELNNALLSRVRVYVLRPLTEQDLTQVINQAIHYYQQCGQSLSLTAKAQAQLVAVADGDARRLLNLLQIAVDLTLDGESGCLTEAIVKQAVSGAALRRFDKQGNVFYEQISALHKAVRGSAPDASLYWLMRMLEGGCDPLYIARRVVRMASEDVGLADPRALQLALNAWDVQSRLGHPEGELALAQAVLYLACAPKSNAAYLAMQKAQAEVTNSPSYEVPLHLRNAPGALLKELGYGKGYRYAHDEPEGFAAGENYFPEALATSRYYQPTNRGLETKIAAKLDYLQQLNQQSPQQRYGKPNS
jgi:putative ATPase